MREGMWGGGRVSWMVRERESGVEGKDREERNTHTWRQLLKSCKCKLYCIHVNHFRCAYRRSHSPSN